MERNVNIHEGPIPKFQDSTVTGQPHIDPAYYRSVAVDRDLQNPRMKGRHP